MNGDTRDMIRRTGGDRRADARETDRRSVMSNSAQYIKLIRKIPLFSGLRVDQFKKILRICARFDIDKGTTLCKVGEDSHTMFILIKGALDVQLEDGTGLSVITPVGLVGEMGVFTGEPRSASVVASEQSIVLAIHRSELMKLFRLDSEIGITILVNVIRDVAQKLKKTNLVIDELRVMSFPGELTRIVTGKNGNDEDNFFDMFDEADD